jgi:hypothetical protein
MSKARGPSRQAGKKPDPPPTAEQTATSETPGAARYQARRRLLEAATARWKSRLQRARGEEETCRRRLQALRKMNEVLVQDHS